MHGLYDCHISDAPTCMACMTVTYLSFSAQIVTEEKMTVLTPYTEIPIDTVHCLVTGKPCMHATVHSIASSIYIGLLTDDH